MFGPMARILSLKNAAASTVSPMIKKYRGNVSTIFTHADIIDASREFFDDRMRCIS